MPGIESPFTIIAVDITQHYDDDDDRFRFFLKGLLFK